MKESSDSAQDGEALPVDEYSTRVEGSTPSPPSAGRPLPVVEGYELLRELGRGGMGVVYEARQRTLNRKVALKMVLSSEHAGERFLARFLAEAKIAAALQHSNIVHIHELGETMGLPYIAMEFVDGSSMADRVRSLGDDFPAVAGFFEKLARATQWAHQNLVVHRDLKPANVLVGRDGEPKIADFGLAKQFGEAAEHAALTRSGEQMGTPAYMAPEQAFPDLGTAGPAADIYSLGVMLYEALTGRVPINGGSHAEMLTLLRTEDPPSPAALRPGLPEDLGTICMKCLRKKSRERYASAGELADDLRRFINGEPILAKPPSPVTAAFRWVRRHRFATAAFSTVLTAAAVALGVNAYLSAKQTEREAEAERKRAGYEYLHVREYTETFANFVRRHGQYVGFGAPLTPEQQAHRSFSYQIVREGREGRCLRMSYVSSAGKPFWVWATADVLAPGLLEGVPKHRLPCVFELRYTADNRVSEERLIDASGQLQARLRYTYPEGYEPGKAQKDFIQADFVDESSRPLETPSGLSSLQFQRDSAGREQRLLYSDTRGIPRKDKFGAGGMEIKYDAQGRTEEVVLLNEKGEPAPNSVGRAIMRMKWDDRQILVSRACFDLEGRPVAVEGVHLTNIENDSWGNPVTIRFFDTDGKTPAGTFSNGAAGPTLLQWTLDDAGFPLTFTSSGYNTKRNGFARLVTSNEWAKDTGLHSTTSCLNDDGTPVRGGGGWQSQQDWTDPAGHVLRTVRDGYDARPPFRTREIETAEWSARGDKLRTTVKYEGSDGQPAMEPVTKASEVTREFDAAERVIHSTHLIPGTSGLPYSRMVIENEWKKDIASDARRFPGLNPDNAGSDTETGITAGRRSVSRIQTALKGAKMVRKSAHYQNAAGGPAPSPKGNTGWIREFDENGYAVRETHTGFASGYPFVSIVITTAWNSGYKGHTDTWRYYNAAGESVRNKEGYREFIEELDDKGRLTRETKTGFDEAAVLYAKEVTEYSDYSGEVYRQRSYQYFDAAGKRVRYQGDYMDYVESFDGKGNPLLIEVSGYNPEKCSWASQTTRLETSADGTTLTYIRAWKDAAGKPARGSYGELESREVFATADDHRIASIASGFDEATHGFVTRTIHFAGKDTVESLEYVDSKGRPVTSLRPFIARVNPGGPAAGLKLQPGDLILSYNGVPPSDSFDFSSSHKLTGGTMEILRNGKRLKIDHVPPGKLGVTLEDRVYVP